MCLCFNADGPSCFYSAGGHFQVRHFGNQPQTSSEETPAAERPGESHKQHFLMTSFIHSGGYFHQSCSKTFTHIQPWFPAASILHQHSHLVAGGVTAGCQIWGETRRLLQRLNSLQSLFDCLAFVWCISVLVLHGKMSLFSMLTCTDCPSVNREWCRGRFLTWAPSWRTWWWWTLPWRTTLRSDACLTWLYTEIRFFKSTLTDYYVFIVTHVFFFLCVPYYFRVVWSTLRREERYFYFLVWI